MWNQRRAKGQCIEEEPAIQTGCQAKRDQFHRESEGERVGRRYGAKPTRYPGVKSNHRKQYSASGETGRNRREDEIVPQALLGPKQRQRHDCRGDEQRGSC